MSLYQSQFLRTLSGWLGSDQMGVSRRSCIAATGAALLSAAALQSTDIAAAENRDKGADDEVLYGHGMVWNRDLAGIAGALNLSFDMRVNLDKGSGSGTAHDPLHPEWNLHFAIHSATEKKLPRNESQFVMTGVVTNANSPALVGLPVRIFAQTSQGSTAIAIAIGDLAFAGAGLVVIAIIAILIGLMIPAVQKVKT